MSKELKWKWAYGPYLDPPEGQKESAIKAGYVKVVSKQSADEAIAELKKFAENACLERDDNQKTIDELREEIESLKASHYAEMVDAGMRERRLCRALYKACANWAKCEERINNRDAYEASEYLPSAEDKFRKNAERWSEMESKCRAKAEEYK